MIGGRGPLTSEQVVIGETTFTFQRALPMEAFRIFEELRPGLSALSGPIKMAVSAAKSGEPPEAEFAEAAVQMIASLPRETVDAAIRLLGRHVTFMRPELGSPVSFANDMDSAVKGLSLFQIYEVVLRAFCVNFTDSLDDLRSAWERATE